MKRIVLVLGAGASNAFNSKMELGSDLTEGICSRVFREPAPYLSKVLLAAGYDPIILDSYREDLTEYIRKKRDAKKSYSIDDFMEQYEHKQSYLDITKMMILLHVLGYEGPCLSDATFLKDTWLTELDKYLSAHHILSNENHKLEFNIVTFNYDRLVEEFLFRKNGHLVEDFCDKHVHHVYGKVSHLPWQNKVLKRFFDKNELAPYIHFGHPNYDYKNVQLYSTGINLIYERSQITNVLFKCAISNADTVLFMGFGFDEKNLEVLGITSMKTETLKGKKWIAHVYGCHNPHIENLRQTMFHGLLQTVYKRDCTEFIQQELGREFIS